MNINVLLWQGTSIISIPMWHYKTFIELWIRWNTTGQDIQILAIAWGGQVAK
jgi:hypothetical protein